MTLELNQGILNGELKHFNITEQNNLTFMSTSVSDENCKFNNVWVQGKLNNKYKFIGLTLDFGIYYPKRITVEYYQNNIKMLHKTIDEIDNTWIYVDMKANDIYNLKVIFE